jgi:Ceramidase
MRSFYKNALVAAVAAAAIVAALLLDPLPQDAAYHRFADRRALFGVPNFWNVATNLPFLLVGAWGLLTYRRIASPGLGLHYATLCVAIALVAAGSAYYHLDPSTPALAWDRLPMTVAFMALFSAVIADRISWLAGRALLWPLVVAGLASIAWWVRSEAAGAGDLRPYALVQFLPVALIPLILLLWREGSIEARRLWLALAAYVLAKLAEWLDAAIMGTGGIVGGHALKHLCAALAAWWILRAFQRSPASAL